MKWIYVKAKLRSVDYISHINCFPTREIMDRKLNKIKLKRTQTMVLTSFFVIHPSSSSEWDAAVPEAISVSTDSGSTPILQKEADQVF